LFRLFLTINATKLIAYQSAGGKCSEFLQRVFQEYPRYIWEEIKEQLIARFGETTDHRQAFFILRNRRQKSDETIQPFSDELFTLSRKAYPKLPGHEAFIETELIEIFIDGLRSPELQLKLLKKLSEEIQNICPLLIDRRLILLHYHLSYLCKRIFLFHLTNF
jgi:hypothetical protein